MHQYRVTFMPFGPDGSTTERTITAASWSPGDEWIDFRTEDGAVTHRVASGCVLSVEVLPETFTGEEVLAAAREHIPCEPYPLDEPLADRDVIYHACGAVCETKRCHIPLPEWERDLLAGQAGANVGQTPPEAENRTPGTGQKIGTFYVDVVPRLDREQVEAAVRDAVAQAEADAVYIDHEVVTLAEIRKLRYGLDDSSTAPARLQSFRVKPRIGDRVHYVSEDGVCLPAQVFDVGTVEVNEHNPAGDGRYREALAVSVTTLDTAIHHLGGVLYVPGTYSGGARYAQPCEPMPLITCADMTFPAGTWHWPA